MRSTELPPAPTPPSPALHLLYPQALSSILDQEMWKRLPAALPSLAHALAARNSSSDEAGSNGLPSPGGNAVSLGSAAAQRLGGYAAFERVVVQGNPWRKQQSPRRRRPLAPPAGFGAAADGSSQGVRQLEVDEYGVPLSAGSTPSAAVADAVGGSSRPGSAQWEAAGGSRGGTEGEEAAGGLDGESSDAYGELRPEVVDQGHWADRGQAAGLDRREQPLIASFPFPTTNPLFCLYPPPQHIHMQASSLATVPMGCVASAAAVALT